MSSKTKIVVLHMREVIYTGIFLLLAVLLGILIFFMFGRGGSVSGKNTGNAKQERFTPGIYRESIVLNDSSFDVEVTVDSDKIKSIDLVNLSETTAAMFPLVEPALASLASQIYASQSLDGIQYGNDQKYTSMMLLNCIKKALKKAEN